MRRGSYWISLRSFLAGIRTMKIPNKAQYRLDVLHDTDGRGHTWIHLWTPVFHDGNGPYISIGFYVPGIRRTIRFVRGY